MQATASAHLDQNKRSLQEGHFNGTLSSVVGENKATYSTSTRFSASDQQVEVDDHPEKKWRFQTKKKVYKRKI